jgi:hypothetical protein
MLSTGILKKLQDGRCWGILRKYTPQGREMAKISKELMQSIAARMAVGESLLKIVEEKGMPTYDGIMKAITRDDALYAIYREGRVKQAEFFSDHINTLAREPLPEFKDIRLANAEVQRRRLEIDSLKWTLARTQPWGIRDKKEDAPEQQSITITWGTDAVAVKPENG